MDLLGKTGDESVIDTINEVVKINEIRIKNLDKSLGTYGNIGVSGEIIKQLGLSRTILSKAKDTIYSILLQD